MTCPEGTTLVRWGPPDPTKPARYGAPDTACQACPVRAACGPDGTRGRVIVRAVQADVRDQHRAWMATEAAQTVRTQRSGLIEGVFGTIKGRQQARQVLLRGQANVAAEWTLLATAFNLRTLGTVLTGRLGDGPRQRLATALGSPDLAIAAAA